MLSCREKLFTHSGIFDYSLEGSEIFLRATREMVKYHMDHCSFYEKLMNNANFSYTDITSEESLAKLPFIHANFFKQNVVLSVDSSELQFCARSSGTVGQKSQMFFDASSNAICKQALDNMMNFFSLIDTEKTNYLLYSYEPTSKGCEDTTKTDITFTTYAPAKKIFFALPYDGIKHKFDFFGCVRILQEYEKKGIPVRILGFPSFLYFTLKHMKQMQIKKIQLHPKSCVILGGGWKNYDNEKIPQQELYSMIEDQLGIQQSWCRDLYGALEHSLPYLECENHHMHVPVWSRVLVRDVRTLEVLPKGSPGLLNFVSPYLSSSPTVSVMMGDIAILYEGDKCGCGIKTPYMKVLHRSGLNKSKSCAITAAELLRRECFDKDKS